jgi:hypothetical protein
VRVRPRSTASLACAALAAALLVTGCGGGDKKDGADKPAAAQTKLAPLPKVAPDQVKPLVGRWVGQQAEDYFQFKPDGTGVWIKQKRTLWSGTAIPEGKGKFRFSWEGGDPQSSSYWGVEIADGGGKLTFAGTNQTYTKAKA